MSSPDDGNAAGEKNRDLFQKLGDFLYGATIGVLKEYRDKSIDLAKLATATAYLHSVKTVRRYCLYLLAAFLMVVVVAFSIVVVPLAFIALGPWSAEAKLISLAVFAAVYVMVPLFLLKDFLSEKKWLELSRSEKIISHLTETDQSGD